MLIVNRLNLLTVCLLLGLVLYPALHAQSLSGVPDDTLDIDGLYLEIASANDNFGAFFADDWDDLKTFGLSLEVYPVRNYGVSLAYDILTDRNGAHDQGRIDRLTLAAGREMLDIRSDESSMWGRLMIGAGLRVYGNIGGEVIQQFWHNLMNVKREVQLPYDETTAAGGLAFLTGQWGMDTEINPVETLLLVPPGELGWSLSSSLLAVTAGELEGDVDLTLRFEGTNSLVTTGVRYIYNSGIIDSATLEEVNRRERGFWLLWGAHVGGFFTEYGYHLSRSIANGSFGFSFGEFSYRRSRSARQVLINEVGLTPAPLILINQIRWQPRLFSHSESFLRHILLTFDYRSGNGPRFLYPDYLVKVEQFAMGLCLQLFPPQKGWQVNPFFTALAGLRHEGLFPQSNERSHAIERVVFPLMHGELGVRFSFGPLFERWPDVMYSLGIAVEGFVQFPYLESDPGRFYDSGVAREVKVSLRFAAMALE